MVKALRRRPLKLVEAYGLVQSPVSKSRRLQRSMTTQPQMARFKWKTFALAKGDTTPCIHTFTDEVSGFKVKTIGGACGHSCQFVQVPTTS